MRQTRGEGATVDKALLGNNLITAKNISVQSYAAVTAGAAAAPAAAPAAATQGYARMGGYGLPMAGMGGYSSVSGYNAMGFLR